MIDTYVFHLGGERCEAHLMHSWIGLPESSLSPEAARRATCAGWFVPSAVMGQDAQSCRSNATARQISIFVVNTRRPNISWPLIVAETAYTLLFVVRILRVVRMPNWPATI